MQKIVKKIIIPFLSIIFIIIPVFAFAQGFLEDGFMSTEKIAINAGYSATSTDAAQADLIDTIVNYVAIALGFTGTIIVLIIMYSGWIYITSEGNQEKITESLKWLKNAFIGLVIILGAYALTAFALRSILESVM